MFIHGKEVVRCFKAEDLKKLPKSRMIDFLPGLKVNSSLDMKLLSKWENYFRLKNVPYAVVKSSSGAHLYLYKEQKGYIKTSLGEALNTNL